jgi:hypothetical protein
MENEIQEIAARLKEIAKQSLIDRDWWDISDKDVLREVDRLLREELYKEEGEEV